MRIFMEKCLYNRLSVGGSAPEPQLASGGWGLRFLPQGAGYPSYATAFSALIKPSF